MPIIDIHYASPMSDDQAAELIKSLTDAYVGVTGTNPEALHVVLEQVDPTRWGVGGRTLAARRAS